MHRMRDSTIAVFAVTLCHVTCTVVDGYEPTYREMMEWARNDYYGALGVSPDIEQRALAKHYRKLSLQLHPDKNKGREDEVQEQFREAADAYGVLKNKEVRAAYNDFMAKIPAAFRPKFDEKPVMETRNLLVLMVVVISLCQYAYWHHRRNSIIEVMMRDPQWRNKLAKATREGKEVKITGAEPPEILDVLFFVLPFVPFWTPMWCYHRLRWFIEQGILGREMCKEEEKYWLKRELGWTDFEYEEHDKKREAAYRAAGGKEAYLAAQQAAQEHRMRKYMRKYGRG